MLARCEAALDQSADVDRERARLPRWRLLARRKLIRRERELLAEADWYMSLYDTRRR